MVRQKMTDLGLGMENDAGSHQWVANSNRADNLREMEGSSVIFGISEWFEE